MINWKDNLHIPEQAQVSHEACDLILKLCTSPDQRLGKNATEVKAHPYFRNVDFDKGLRSQKAPFVPHLDNPTDTSNFDDIDADKVRSSCGGSTDSEQDFGKPFHGFFEFTFRRFFDDGGGPGYPRLPMGMCPDEHDPIPQGPVYV